jgi:hypothetical protein
VITKDAFAKDGRYSSDSTSQAASVNNERLNPILDSNTIDNVVDVGNCGGTVSQQDESGEASAPITLQNANPTIELQRATTTTQPPPTEEPPGQEEPQDPDPFGTCLAGGHFKCGRVHFGATCNGCDNMTFTVDTNPECCTPYPPALLSIEPGECSFPVGECQPINFTACGFDIACLF